MKVENFEAAVHFYGKAIELNPANAVYFCNRYARGPAPGRRETCALREHGAPGPTDAAWPGRRRRRWEPRLAGAVSFLFFKLHAST